MQKLHSTILTVNELLPPAVKWLFDLFDEAARVHGIMNPEVVHAWKSNSLPLRFWVNLIKNPDFIFDINKTATVDSSLSVIAQTFMDACSLMEHRLCKDSPSNKLLFAKDLPAYREMVIQFYSAVSKLPQVTDQELSTSMQQLSVQQLNEFDTLSALKELYIYVSKYREQIILGLEMDTICNNMHLAHKLKNVACTMEDASNKPVPKPSRKRQHGAKNRRARPEVYQEANVDRTGCGRGRTDADRAIGRRGRVNKPAEGGDSTKGDENDFVNTDDDSDSDIVFNGMLPDNDDAICIFCDLIFPVDSEASGAPIVTAPVCAAHFAHKGGAALIIPNDFKQCETA
ncbi:Plexin-B [Eumeta japonica]|uniref:Plexin-B n=1 Tax=Eumeta variegata TaxID=151549 RepID=A0A4C1VE58_EUMVA|nr:Plexin-B [Eumeta japonica]